MNDMTFTTAEHDPLMAGLTSLRHITDQVQISSIFETGKVEHYRIDCMMDKVRALHQDDVEKICAAGKWGGGPFPAAWLKSRTVVKVHIIAKPRLSTDGTVRPETTRFFVV